MQAGARLALYGAGLVVAFGGAFAVAGVLIPDNFVAAWAAGSETDGHNDGQSVTAPEPATDARSGLSLDTDGFLLSPVDAPTTIGEAGELSFQVQTAAGEPVTEFTEAHEKDLHLIVVRSDGTGFRHVHPELDASTGTWSVPWTWEAAGSYRVYADFTPSAGDAEGLTLTRTVEVAGDVTPVTTEVQRTAEVDGFTVTLAGELTAGEPGTLTLSVERGGMPVTALEAYLGAFGHLVALREGDLAYLHVHPEGSEPEAGETGGPEIGFTAEAPTAGRYLLYLDFQVDGEVRTASFVIDAVAGDGAGDEDAHSGGH
ncbi:hypothetical protein D1J51_13110 [Leucobacter sp. wl10]|nr:hypothetical protein D1J51_13110 [Leucobacter sp. wl10]